MAVGEGIVVGEISSLLRRIGSFKDTVEHRIGQALVIDRLLDHHTSPAEGPVPGAGRTKTSCPEFIRAGCFAACRKSYAFAPSCLRTGPLAPFAPNDGFRRSLRFARLGTRLAGRRGVILNEKGASARLSAREASHRSDTHLRVQSPLLFQAFPRTFLLLLCLFRQSEACNPFNKDCTLFL